MTKFFDLFPQELKDQVIDYRLKGKKKPIVKAHPGKPGSNSFAFTKIKKLPLETERQVLSALNHFYNVAGVSEDERREAFKKIIDKADYFKICTMGFRNKYSQYL